LYRIVLPELLDLLSLISIFAKNPKENIILHFSSKKTTIQATFTRDSQAIEPLILAQKSKN